MSPPTVHSLPPSPPTHHPHQPHPTSHSPTTARTTPVTPLRKRQRTMLFKSPFRLSTSHRRRQHRRSPPPSSSSAPLDPVTHSTSTAGAITPPTSPNSMPVPFPWPFGQPCKSTSRRGRDLGSASSSIRGCTPSAPSSSPPLSRSTTRSEEPMGGFEMHPGTPVDFTSPSPSPTEEQEEWEMEWREETWSVSLFHDTVENTSEPESIRGLHNVLPSSAPPSRTSWRTSHPPSPPTPASPPSHRTNVDYKAAKLHRRTRSEEQRELLHRESYTTSLAAKGSHSHSHSTSSNETTFSNESETQRQGSQSSASSLGIDEYVQVLQRTRTSDFQIEGDVHGTGRCANGASSGMSSPIFVDEWCGDADGRGWFLVGRDDGGVLDTCMRASACES